MLPWSVMASAGWPSATAAATSVADPGRTVEHRVLGVLVQMDEGCVVSRCALALDHRFAHSLSTGAVHSLWTITTPLSLALLHDSRSGEDRTPPSRAPMPTAGCSSPRSVLCATL